ncbi:hypothetical protein B6I21_02440 [candidate division KSB1 bacterium 4572_119]|nr:MAG: hypothetical protein B6I21_02440 [candidate division KSB1 bacterium 4572_119]
MRVLIIDDEKNICSSLSGFLEDLGHKAEACFDGGAGLQKALEESFDLIFLDVKMPVKNGLEVLENLRKVKTEQPVIMISGEADLQTAVTAIKLGANSFLEKPLNPDKVHLEVKNFERQFEMMREVSNLKKLIDYEYQLIGMSASLGRIRDEIKRAAPSVGRILIYGENGTGKELVAREIHQQSHRKNGPFVKINCAAIPKDLIESELFGHEKGAFTGAIKTKKGLFEEADGGTLLLDEVGDLSLESQAKLLRVLQENEFQRVGGTSTIKFNTRIISATNKNLQDEIRRGAFREDLFFRLNVVPIRVPPLRERIEDIGILARHFLAAYSEKNAKKLKSISEQALLPMLNYPWPGNVRELKNFIERLVIMTDDNEIKLETVMSLLPETRAGKSRQDFEVDERIESQSLKEIMESYERKILIHEYEKSNHNVSRMAKELKTDRPNLHRKLKKYGIKS